MLLFCQKAFCLVTLYKENVFHKYLHFCVTIIRRKSFLNGRRSLVGGDGVRFAHFGEKEDVRKLARAKLLLLGFSTLLALLTRESR